MFDLGTGLLGVLSVRKLIEKQFEMPEEPPVELPRLCPEEIRPKHLSWIAFLRLPQLLRLVKIINR